MDTNKNLTSIWFILGFLAFACIGISLFTLIGGEQGWLPTTERYWYDKSTYLMTFVFSSLAALGFSIAFLIVGISIKEKGGFYTVGWAIFVLVCSLLYCGFTFLIMMGM